MCPDDSTGHYLLRNLPVPGQPDVTTSHSTAVAKAVYFQLSPVISAPSSTFASTAICKTIWKTRLGTGLLE